MNCPGLVFGLSDSVGNRWRASVVVICSGSSSTACPTLLMPCRQSLLWDAVLLFRAILNQGA